MAMRRFLLLTMVAVLSAAPLWAQSEASTGGLRGTVSDPSGALIPNAKITAKNPETGFARATSTGEDGYYILTLLPVGSYELRIEAAGFATLVRSNIPVNVGRVYTVNLEMKVGAATQVIEVQAGAELIETTRTQVASVVDENAVRQLPIHGRNYLDFVLLTPGVVRDNNRAGDISFGGLKGTLNSLQIDGVDNNNNFFGQALGRTGVRAPFQFSQEAVAEFQVKTNSYSAEYGRAGGAVINVVTKSGANDFHGSGFFFLRDNGVNANKWELNRAGRARPDLRVWQYGGIASGPIVRDQAFWLLNYDAQRRKEPNAILCPFPPASVNAAACTAASADAFLGPRIMDYQKALDQDVFFGKADWRLGSNHNLSIRYNYQRFTGGNQENSGDTSVLEHTGNSLVRTHTLSGNLISSFGPRWMNEFRAQWGRDSEPGLANGTDPELQLRQAGTLFLQFGRNNFSPRETTIKRAQFVDTVTYLVGKHTLKFGVDINIERILNFFPGLFGGRYSFNCLADFQDNMRPDGSTGCAAGTYTQSFAGAGTPGPTTHPDITEYSGFVQGDYRAWSNLTLSWGIRYDFQAVNPPRIFNPSTQLASLGVNTAQMNSDRNNLGPRVGFAWSPRFRKTTVVRGGYGIYYGRTPSIMTATATSNNGLQVISLTLSGTSALLPATFAYPQTLSAPPTGATPATPNLYVFAHKYVQPYVQQASLGLEVQLHDKWVVSGNYLFVRGTHLARSNNINLGTPVPTAIPISTGGSLMFNRFSSTRPASSFARITEFQSNANSFYHAATLTVHKRFSHHVETTVNYTFSKAIDDVPDFTSVVPGNAGDDVKMAADPKNLRFDRGLSDQDFRHRLIVMNRWELDFFNKHSNFFVRHVLGHWSYSSISALQNGRRYSIRIGGDPNNDGNNFNDRALGVARNTQKLPAQISTDLRIQHDFPFTERFKLLFLFEVFNLWNRPNFRDANNLQFNRSTATAANATANCPVGTSCLFPVATFTPANPKDLFVGTFDHPGGGSNFPGPGPRTLQFGAKLTW